MIEITSALNGTGERCAVGFLAMRGVRGPAGDALAREKAAVESALRAAYGSTSRAERKALYPMRAYVEYDKRFGYSYHVLGQIESVLKGKEIPDALPPVAAMFMAELKNMLLTAGHDLDKVEGPVAIARADGSETYEAMGGRLATTVPGDVMVRDGASILSSILRGPDRRTAITAETDRVLYVVYAPDGVERALVESHLDDIARYVHLFAGNAAEEGRAILE